MMVELQLFSGTPEVHFFLRSKDLAALMIQAKAAFSLDGSCL